MLRCQSLHIIFQEAAPDSTAFSDTGITDPTYIQNNLLAEFRKWMDNTTEHLLDVFSLTVRPWGTARKAVNLFLRDVLYNRYLCSKFKIDK